MGGDPIHIQAVRMGGNSLVSGHVIFYGGNGKIILSPNARFTGTVLGGKVI